MTIDEMRMITEHGGERTMLAKNFLTKKESQKGCNQNGAVALDIFFNFLTPREADVHEIQITCLCRKDRRLLFKNSALKRLRSSLRALESA